MSLPTLTIEELTLRPQRKEDLDAVATIVSSPDVREWWGVIGDRDELIHEIENDGVAFTIEIAGEIAGWLGVWEENDPGYRHAGLDIMLDSAHHGRGIGPRALRAAAAWLIDERGHHRITIDPALANRRAIRAYETVGFRPVGVLRSYERDPAGGWRDGLLMDMLASELARGA